MRPTSLTTLVLVAFASIAAAACDNAIEASAPGHDELALVAAPEPASVEIPMCRASATTARDAIEKVLAPAAACEVDADCTITVTDTRCTGELVLAVNADQEETFLLLADKLDARHCAEAPAACGVSEVDASASATAVCVQSRCVVAD